MNPFPVVCLQVYLQRKPHRRAAVEGFWGGAVPELDTRLEPSSAGADFPEDFVSQLVRDHAQNKGVSTMGEG